MNLAKVLSGLPSGMLISSVPDVHISGIAIDSRRVEPGDLFVALRGGSADGHRVRGRRHRRGARRRSPVKTSLGALAAPYVRLRSTRRALSRIAAAFYGWPGRQPARHRRHRHRRQDNDREPHPPHPAGGRHPSGLISTVNAVIGDEELDTGFHVTTPDAHDVQHYMQQMVEAGLDPCRP